MSRLDTLQSHLETHLGARVQRMNRTLGEITIQVAAGDSIEAARLLHEHEDLHFEQLIDLCGVDYSTYGGEGETLYEGPRFCVVTHLLSLKHNWRLRLKVYCPDDDLPMVPTLTGVWNAADWFEREAFDLYGIVFDGHLDLRRILTDYGFIGHPFRKDFPVSGHVEMRYDPEQKRVIYQPVTIEPRVITPRVIREEHYGEVR